MLESFAQMEKQIKETPKEQDEMMNKTAAQLNEQLKQEYTAKLSDWEHQYPQSPKLLIKQRLEEYLRLSSTVNFSAKLKDGPNSTKIFVTDEYELTDGKWKQCFRAGKEANEAAQKVVRDWLKDLN